MNADKQAERWQDGKTFLKKYMRNINIIMEVGRFGGRRQRGQICPKMFQKIIYDEGQEERGKWQ